MSLRLVAKAITVFVMVAGIHGTAEAEISDRGKSVSVRFPAFSLSPGERISGMKLTTSAGKVSSSCRPSGWRCDYAGSTIHCYGAHSQYAIAISGLLPEIFINNANGSFSLAASVDFIDNSGREYTREFRESELIVK